jgi:hypothetical protein
VSRPFRVGVRVSVTYIYEVDLAGTVDPEQASVDWLAVTQDLSPAEETSHSVTVDFAEEVRGQ